MQIDASEFRRVLGHLPTGVTAITAAVEGEPVGMAANSVTSVSLDPPMILLCPAQTSTTWPAIREARRFCVNVMAAQHEEVTRQFARKDADRFAGVGWHPRSHGPGLDDAVAWIGCELHEELAAGDHTIALAGVQHIEAAAIGVPLVFFRGRYGTFSELRNEPEHM